MRKRGVESRKERDYTIELKSGILFLPPNDIIGDVSVFNEVFLDGSYETSYKDSVVIDLGGHRGYFGAYALTMGAKAVNTFEPEPRNYDVLRRCVESFRASGHRWTIEKAAVADRDGEADFYLWEESYGHSLYSMGEGSALAGTKVEVRSIASVLQEPDLANQRVIAKVDIEGAECEVILRGGADWGLVDEIFMEFHDLGRCTMDEIVDHLGSFGLVLAGSSPTSNAEMHSYHFVRRPERDVP
ncbi:MAG: FkbM family methyltransferase [Actinomycetota bacterium]